MKKINRELALNLLSCIEIIDYSKDEIGQILSADYIDDEGESRQYDNIFSPEVQFFLIGYIKDVKNYGVINSFLEQIVQNIGINDCSIEGNPPLLEKCPCCEYRTIKEKGAHEICRVCFWEDGGRDINIGDFYSHANHMTLKEAKTNFEKMGACSAEAKQFVDKQGTLKFAKA
jgi:hypothetical protein